MGIVGSLPLDLPGQIGTKVWGDRRLAQNAADGEPRAFTAIYRRYHQELYRYCRSILGNHDDAQDAMQATMVKALRALPRQGGDVELKPWLFGIAHNEAIDLWRARLPVAALDSEHPDPQPAVENQAATRERLRELVHDLDDLPERQRASLVMRELNGLSYEEIGRAFAMRPATAKQTVYQARQALVQISEGRDMGCDPVRRALSAMDRRLLRSRRIRSHLRECESCCEFESAIVDRSTGLAILCPPLALPAAFAGLQTALASVGGSAGATGTVGAAAGGTAGGGLGATAGFGIAGGAVAGGGGFKALVAMLATATGAGGAALVVSEAHLITPPASSAAIERSLPTGELTSSLDAASTAVPTGEFFAASGANGSKARGGASSRGPKHGSAGGRAPAVLEGSNSASPTPAAGSPSGGGGSSSGGGSSPGGAGEPVSLGAAENPPKPDDSPVVVEPDTKPPKPPKTSKSPQPAAPPELAAQEIQDVPGSGSPPGDDVTEVDKQAKLPEPAEAPDLADVPE